jgi:hypothetical protein
MCGVADREVVLESKDGERDRAIIGKLRLHASHYIFLNSYHDVNKHCPVNDACGGSLAIEFNPAKDVQLRSWKLPIASREVSSPRTAKENARSNRVGDDVIGHDARTAPSTTSVRLLINLKLMSTASSPTIISLYC